jgi:hypothetical protein
MGVVDGIMKPERGFYSNRSSGEMSYRIELIQALFNMAGIMVMPVRLDVSGCQNLEPRVAVAAKRGIPPQLPPSILESVHE